MERLSNMNLSYKAIRHGNQNTQNYRVGVFLNSGEHLTQLSSSNNLDGVQRLAARVEKINRNLRASGYPTIKNTIKRTPNGKRYSFYAGFVPADVLENL